MNSSLVVTLTFVLLYSKSASPAKEEAPIDNERPENHPSNKVSNHGEHFEVELPNSCNTEATLQLDIFVT